MAHAKLADGTAGGSGTSAGAVRWLAAEGYRVAIIDTLRWLQACDEGTEYKDR